MSAVSLAPRALYEEVAELLRQRIFRRELEPGSWIDELKLAQQYGISRTPLREALKVLAAEGLVTMKVRRGAYVTEVSEQDLAEVYHLLSLLESDALLRAVRPFVEDPARMVAVGDIEPVLSMPAGTDAEESGEIARVYGTLGVNSMIPTRIDIARRLGGLLSAAHYGGLIFADASHTPKVADGLIGLSPKRLTALLTGTCEVQESLETAGALAVLDATNRWLAIER